MNNELLQAVKQLRNELGLRYDADKLVQLYHAIDKLYESVYPPPPAEPVVDQTICQKIFDQYIEGVFQYINDERDQPLLLLLTQVEKQLAEPVVTLKRINAFRHSVAAWVGRHVHTMSSQGVSSRAALDGLRWNDNPELKPAIQRLTLFIMLLSLGRAAEDRDWAKATVV